MSGWCRRFVILVSHCIDVRYLVVCGRLAHVPMSLRARPSVLDTCKVENVMNSWAARDSVENGSDSSGYDTSDCGTVGALISRWLLYSDSCSKYFSLTLVACRVSVFHSVAFSDSWDYVLGSHRVP